MKGKNHFTYAEIIQLRTLISTLHDLPSGKQKNVRGLMRNMGFYISDFATSMSPELFEQLIEKGDIVISDKAGNTPNYDKHSSDTGKRLAGVNMSQSVKGRSNSDEYYVINLCDKLLGKKASRQHRFSFLLGDAGVSLPVDAYYQDLNLVIEYYERQHTESVKLFDNRMTVSGVSRGEQRKIYDERRKKVLPEHGIKLIVISYSDFGSTKKLQRNENRDTEIIRKILSCNGVL